MLLFDPELVIKSEKIQVSKNADSAELWFPIEDFEIQVQCGAESTTTYQPTVLGQYFLPESTFKWCWENIQKYDDSLTTIGGSVFVFGAVFGASIRFTNNFTIIYYGMFLCYIVSFPFLFYSFCFLHVNLLRPILGSFETWYIAINCHLAMFLLWALYPLPWSFLHWLQMIASHIYIPIMYFFDAVCVFTDHRMAAFVFTGYTLFGTLLFLWTLTNCDIPDTTWKFWTIEIHGLSVLRSALLNFNVFSIKLTVNVIFHPTQCLLLKENATKSIRVKPSYF